MDTIEVPQFEYRREEEIYNSIPYQFSILLDAFIMPPQHLHLLKQIRTCDIWRIDNNAMSIQKA